MTIQDYLRVLRERWLAVVLAVLLGLGGAAAAFFLRPAEYTAKLTILICPYQQTTRAQLATAVSSLQNVSAALLSTVFTMVPAAGQQAYAQYNSYYRNEKASDSAAEAANFATSSPGRRHQPTSPVAPVHNGRSTTPTPAPGPVTTVRHSSAASELRPRLQAPTRNGHSTHRD